VRFWDTSAVLPLIIEQEASGEIRPLLEEDRDVATWWGTPVEFASAAARLRREGLIDMEGEEAALGLIRRLREAWLEILPSADLREEAMRLVRRHPLRASDALQLAAALLWSDGSLDRELVTLDERLGLVARLEGLRVLPAKKSGRAQIEPDR
jgi:predicted nucleic acid-binding protein